MRKFHETVRRDCSSCHILHNSRGSRTTGTSVMQCETVSVALEQFDSTWISSCVFRLIVAYLDLAIRRAETTWIELAHWKERVSSCLLSSWMVHIVAASFLHRAIATLPYLIKRELKTKVTTIPGLTFNPRAKPLKNLRNLLENVGVNAPCGFYFF